MTNPPPPSRGEPKPPNMQQIEWISFRRASEFLEKAHGIRRTRMTIRNWAFVGVHRGVGQITKLKYRERAGRHYTTRKWLMAFINATSRS